MKSKRYCYWSVADGNYGLMMETVIKSARNVGVQEDFHIWTDKQIEGAESHSCGNYNKEHYLFKLKFLKKEVSKLKYDYFIFLDSDSYFVRNPGNMLEHLHGSPVHVCMESDCTSEEVTRPDWWGCPISEYIQLMKQRGVRSKSIFNTNAGFWIVKKTAIDTVYDLAMSFWEYANLKGYTFTEESPLAYVGHMLMGNPYKHTLKNNTDLWASDWIGWYKDKLPDGLEFPFEDYMSGRRFMVNPSIVHCMRSKKALIEGIYE